VEINTGTNDLLASLAENVLTLTMNRPDARNAMSGPMTAALAEQLAKALATCDKLKKGKHRTACVAVARKRYRALKLAAALKACTKLKKAKRRTACVAAARRTY